ncbi:MAG: hypothetical protein Tsb0019_40990 [Roseibium sp.]
MREKIERGLAQVYSILPEDRIAGAIDATLERLKTDASLARAILKWADFDETGRFLRGGVSDLTDYVVRIVSRPADDSDLAAMAQEAADGAAEPGRLICSPDRERFTLFLPDTISTAETRPKPIVRGFLIDMAVFTRIHLAFQSGSQLTEAERRVAFQLLAGLSLREAATLDGVGIETKRAQIKNATAKLQCSGQIDLVRLLMGQLSIVLALADDETRYTAFAESFMAGHLGDDVRLTVERLPNGHVLRCVEAGPADGHPVVVLHGMMFGMLLSGVRKNLETTGLRLLMPLRHGYLDMRPILDFRATSRLIAESQKDLTQFIERRGLAPATLLGHSLGAALAMQFAEQNPKLVGRLVLLTANTAGSDETRGSYTDMLYGGYKALGESMSLSRAVTFEFSRHYPDAQVARAILDRMFADSAADIAAMAGVGAAAPVLDWFPDLYRSSVSGISEDYDFVMNMRAPKALPAIACLFIHGTDDPLTPIGEIERLVRETPSASLRAIQGAGHFAAASHADEVWSSIAEFVSAA